MAAARNWSSRGTRSRRSPISPSTGVSFVQAATVLLDALALTVFDAAHSQGEERWFTLGMSSEGRLLAVSHTYQHTGPIDVRVRIVSAREATRRERQQYENEPR